MAILKLTSFFFDTGFFAGYSSAGIVLVFPFVLLSNPLFSCRKQEYIQL
jgi:hypothetical protein